MADVSIKLNLEESVVVRNVCKEKLLELRKAVEESSSVERYSNSGRELIRRYDALDSAVRKMG